MYPSSTQFELEILASQLLRNERISSAMLPIPNGKFIAIGTLDDILRLIKLQVVDESQ